MTSDISKQSFDFVDKMNTHTRKLLKNENRKQLWENTFIKHQIDKRNVGCVFSVSDHIQAMVYAMLSSGISWKRVQSDTDMETGCIFTIDKVFCQYDTEKLSKLAPEKLYEQIRALHFGSQFTRKQMAALKEINIPKLLAIEKKFGNIDKYYETYIQTDTTMKGLVNTLSLSQSENKMSQLGFALSCEYLRNVGYDIPKPDRHICRILGKSCLALSNRQQALPSEAYDIVRKLAQKGKKSVAETDYIIWSYCAKGYGEICTKRLPKCNICVADNICNKGGTFI